MANTQTPQTTGTTGQHLRAAGHEAKEALTPGHHGHHHRTGAAGEGAYEGTGTAGAGYAGGGAGIEGRTGTYQTTAEVPVQVQQTTTTAPVARQGQEAVCSQEFFKKTEDRPIVKERVEYIKEHRPVEKEFVVETRATGVERELVEGRTVEHMGTQERIVSEAQPRAPCD